MLYVTTSDRGWLLECLASDTATDVRVQEAVGSGAGLAALREESFDAVVVRHGPPELDAVAFVEAVRASGDEYAVVVIGHPADDDLTVASCEAGADDYLPITSATPRRTLWALASAIEWRRLKRENRQLAEHQRHRLRLEHNEAERLLAQQRELLSGLEELTQTPPLANSSIAGESSSLLPLEAPSSLVSHYVDLLRAQIVMGSGNLAAETSAVVDSLHALNLPIARVMQVHLHALETTLRGLGSRSSRHVMARADLLVLEVMMQLAERYRRDAGADK